MLVGLKTNRPKKQIDATIKQMGMDLLKDIRKYVAIPISYTVDNLKSDEKRHDRDYYTGSSLHKGILALQRETGLTGTDMHDANVMSRENGDLVIVDVGLFRGGSQLQESRKIRIKLLTNQRK